MKKLTTLLFLLFASAAFAQTDYSKIPVGTTAECKEAEPSVLTAAELILSKPLNDAEAKKAGAFLIKWMTNTEYSFTLDEKITKLTKKKGNENLLLVYMACQAKYLLENKDKAKDNEALETGAFSLLADYVADSSHGVVMTKDLQKLVDAKKNGKMEDYVKTKK